MPLGLGEPPAKEVALGLVAGQREGLPEGRVAAGEDQTQPIVGHRILPLVLARRVERREALQLLELLPKAGLAPQAVDGLVACRLDHPRARIRGRALARPLLERRLKRLLHDLFGEVEVAE